LQLINSDCLQALKDIPDNSIDSLVTDPPYGWKFMGKKWDYDIPSIEVWTECLRVLKPGAHALVCCGTRTQHRMAVNLEDAGFEIRDLIAWVYGSGFPKSLNIGKAIDNNLGKQRPRTIKAEPRSTLHGDRPWIKEAKENGYYFQDNNPITPQSKQYEGWGTALKPSMELWTLCRKPLEGTVANNVLKYGTGGINIDGCRVPAEEGFADWVSKTANPNGTNKGIGRYGDGFQGIGKTFDNYKPKSDARFPANLIHDGSDEVVGLFPNGSSRFFYTPKASKSERNMGCEGLEYKTPSECCEDRQPDSAGLNNPRAGAGRTSGSKNHHPTVKPVSLMRYLCRLITPPRGMVLDPYMGSGSTGIACKLEGFDFTGIEIDPEYIKIAEARINSVKQAVLV
jgi:DNA modification methylase